MKKISLFIASSVLMTGLSLAHAASAPVMPVQSNSFWSWHSLYALGQVGWENTQVSSYASTINQLPAGVDIIGSIHQSHAATSGVAGRIALGYELLPRYLDVQLGYTQYQSSYQNITADILHGGVPFTFTLASRDKLSTVDLSLEGKLPYRQFYLAGKVGVAYTVFAESNDATLSGSLLNEAVTDDQTTYTYRPLVGAGIGYNANDYVFVEAMYQYLFGTGNTVTSSHPVPNTQFLSLGLGCHF